MCTRPSGSMSKAAPSPRSNAAVWSSVRDKLALRTLDPLPSFGRRLGSAQPLDESGSQEQARQPRQDAQMRAVVTTADEEEDVRQAAVLGPERNAGRRPPVSEDRFTQ